MKPDSPEFKRWEQQLSESISQVGKEAQQIGGFELKKLYVTLTTRFTRVKQLLRRKDVYVFEPHKLISFNQLNTSIPHADWMEELPAGFGGEWPVEA